MSDQIRSKPEAKQLKQEQDNRDDAQEQLDDSVKGEEFTADNFKDYQQTKALYDRLTIEYNQRISKNFAKIAHSEAGLEPYWDHKKNKPQKLPLNQHNVSSKRFNHSTTQLGLTYNSFFPNQSYAKNLLEIDIFPREFDTGNGVAEGETSATLDAEARVIQQGFDQVIKEPLWAKLQHTRMVHDNINYGVGVLYFPNKTTYKYTAVDFAKMKFPIGTSIDPSGWDYCFMEHEISVETLRRRIKVTPKGWNRARLVELMRTLTENPSNSPTDSKTNPSPLDKIDSLREGVSSCAADVVAPSSIPLVSCFWKNDSGKVSRVMFASGDLVSDGFLYDYDNEFDSFEDQFSVFPAEETKDEIRMVTGWGHKIYNLCHAYDREFSRMLDHIAQSSTTFIQMDPADAHKKILHLGSLNIGQYENVQQLSSNLTAIVSALVFLDSKIEQITFTKGLNKSEMKGEGRGAELATVLLSMEGRIHKHFLSRFIDRYSAHWRKVLSRLIKISNSKTELRTFPEVEAKFYDYAIARGVQKSTMQLDNKSEATDNLPSNWRVSARKPDGTGINPGSFSALQALQPFLSSLPEPGLKVVLERVVMEAFNDVDMIGQVFPNSETTKVFSETDIQTATVYASQLTTAVSDFDGSELEANGDIDPQATDLHKFETFPASRQNDHEIFANIYLNKVDESVERFNKREIGRPTLHIWLFNLVSSAQEHVSLLRADNIRSGRSAAQEVFDRFGGAFNLLRQVESQANAERSQKLDQLSQTLAEQEQDNPEKIKAQAQLETARARQAEVTAKFRSDQFNQEIELVRERRAEQNHVMDLALKQKSLREPSASQVKMAEVVSQSNLGRPRDNQQ